MKKVAKLNDSVEVGSDAWWDAEEARWDAADRAEEEAESRALRAVLRSFGRLIKQHAGKAYIDTALAQLTALEGEGLMHNLGSFRELYEAMKDFKGEVAEFKAQFQAALRTYALLTPARRRALEGNIARQEKELIAAREAREAQAAELAVERREREAQVAENARQVSVIATQQARIAELEAQQAGKSKKRPCRTGTEFFEEDTREGKKQKVAPATKSLPPRRARRK